LVKVEVGGIGEISDPPLVSTDHPLYYLRLSSAFKFIKTEPRARHARGNNKKIIDFTDSAYRLMLYNKGNALEIGLG
jgi:hypothetical protein